MNFGLIMCPLTGLDIFLAKHQPSIIRFSYPHKGGGHVSMMLKKNTFLGIIEPELEVVIEPLLPSLL